MDNLELQWNEFLKEKRMNEKFICSTIGKEYDIYKIFKMFPDEPTKGRGIVMVDDDDSFAADDTVTVTDTELHISTRTCIAHVKSVAEAATDAAAAAAAAAAPLLDIYRLFWKLPIIDFSEMREGIVKKVIKYDVYSESAVEELDAICAQHRETTGCEVVEQILKHITHVKKQPAKKPKYWKRAAAAAAAATVTANETAVIDTNPAPAPAPAAAPQEERKITHQRKIIIGKCKKNILNDMKKKKAKEAKSAFSNCLAINIRYGGVGGVNPAVPLDFHEYHVKIFNTGKIEIPGIKNTDTFKGLLGMITAHMSEVLNTRLAFVIDDSEMVLINSTFYCGHEINREALSTILSNKYRLSCTYDPGVYPGILCEFYYDMSLPFEQQTGSCPTDHKPDASKKIVKENVSTITYMIFRTGKILILGKCVEQVIRNLYQYMKRILETERAAIV